MAIQLIKREIFILKCLLKTKYFIFYSCFLFTCIFCSPVAALGLQVWARPCVVPQPEMGQWRKGDLKEAHLYRDAPSIWAIAAPPHTVIFLKRPPNYSGKLLHARAGLHLWHVVLCFLILCFDKIEIKNCLPFEIVNAPFTFIAKFAIIWRPGSEETGNTSKKIFWQFGQLFHSQKHFE